jgi:hypothetical protein
MLTFTVTFKGVSQSSMPFRTELYNVAAVILIFRLRLIDSNFFQDHATKAEVVIKMTPVVHGKAT